MSDVPEIKVRRFSRDKRNPPPPPAPPSTPDVSIQEENNDDLPPIVDDEPFLDDLKDGNIPYEFLPPPPSPPKKKTGGKKKAVRVDPDEFGGGDFHDLFGPEPTPILGKSRRELLTRLSEYRTLFPNELKNFKVKSGASDQQLQEALDEAEVIVNCNGVGKMLDEFLLTVIQAAEAVSSRTEKLDISGTADALRENPEFHRLAKLCWVKHRVFSNAPPEAQLSLVIGSTALICRSQNAKRKEVSSLLNQPL